MGVSRALPSGGSMKAERQLGLRQLSVGLG